MWFPEDRIIQFILRCERFIGLKKELAGTGRYHSYSEKDYIKNIKRVSGPDKISLFHVNCFWRAGVDTCFTIHTHVVVNLCFFVFHGYCRSRTLAYACFASGTFFLVYNGYQTFHSTTIASEGQMSTHVWQSTHNSLSTFAFSFSIAIAEAGHSSTHVSHPVHLLLSTIATNSFTPSYMLEKR